MDIEIEEPPKRPVRVTQNKDGSERKSKKKKKVEGEITRSSCKFLIESWRLSPAHSQKNGNQKEKDKKARKKHAKDEPAEPPACGGKATCAHCYVFDQLYQTRRLVAMASNVGMRRMVRFDEDLLDRFILKNGRMPEKGDAFSFNGYVASYKCVRAAVPQVLSGIIASIAYDVDATWVKWRWDTLIKQVRQAPHYKKAPIPVPADIYNKVYRREDHFALKFSVSSKAGADRRPLELPLIPKDDYQLNLLEGFASGALKLGEASIIEDPRKRGRWYATIAYKRVVPPVPRNERVAAVNRGIGCFFAVTAYDGESWIYKGEDIVAVLKQFQARRRGFQYTWHARGRGAHGHGLSRALAPTDPLLEKATRWRINKIKLLARRLCNWLLERGITALYLEDFAGIRAGAFECLGEHVGQLVQEWPFFKLGLAIHGACEAAGIAVIKVLARGSKEDDIETPAEGETGGIAETCPACGNIDRKAMIFSTRTFQCVKCKFRRHLDVATAINVLIRGERRAGVPAMDPARKERLLGGHAPLRTPSVDAVLAMPETSSGAEGTARKRGRKGAGSNGNGKTGGNEER